jgi:hypothetical protein
MLHKNVTETSNNNGRKTKAPTAHSSITTMLMDYQAKNSEDRHERIQIRHI